VSSSLPTPVAAALGVVPPVLDGAKRVPGRLVQLPILAVSNTLTALEGVRREYEQLVERGEGLVGRLRGLDFDEIEDRVEAVVERTPAAAAYDRVEDTVEDVVDQVSDLLDRAASKPRNVRKEVVDTTAPETAATETVVETVEAVTEVLTTGVPARGDLPLEDYDSLTLGSLRGRLRSLTLDELVHVRDYEKAHAHRLPVVTLLDNRIAKLATEGAAAPAPANPAAKKKAAPKKA
jgi:hypothetical protein